jgi:hypothetical protein
MSYERVVLRHPCFRCDEPRGPLFRLLSRGLARPAAGLTALRLAGA